ncbi:YfhO family protein [Lactococcus nasutitermitis]|uniref:YfhO family protein n=1 Tax=Lactococcus nasutitermitis TaxID=1652957 RepID=A0ABV9JDI3_9LACT|nr:YfhO family protein [Lactococcus nasutitermitis]
MLKFIKNYKWALLASFFVPLLLVLVVLATNGIYWGSGRSLLAGDAYHQYVAVLSLFRNILHSGGQQGFLYTFTSGLGLNLYAFAAYYMGSFLMPLTFFFNVHNMPDAMYLITLLKFACIGLSSFVALKNMYKKLAVLPVLALSVSFSLMSFLMSQIEIIMWLDVFIWLPLIVWGLHSLQDFGRRKLYFISLTILFIQNYYFGFMIAIFLVLYFLVRSTLAKWSWRKLLDFVVTSLLAGLTSLIMLLPMYLDLRANNSDAWSAVTGIFTDNSHVFDIFSKNLVGSYDTTQFNAVPMIYVGLMPLALALLFFTTQTVRLRTKLAFLGLIAFLIASFYLQALDLFWQGMHSPNMFLHRYAFLFSLLLVLLAAETLSRWQEIKIWHILLVVGFLILGFAATVIWGNYHYVKFVNIALTALFGLAYLLLMLSQKRGWISSNLFAIILFIFMSTEVAVNGFYQIQGIQGNWNFASRTYYNQQAKLLQPLATKVQNLTSSNLARTDNTSPDTANDGMKYGYNAIAQFSSVRNSNTSAVMNQLGFHTDSTYLNLRYPQNSLLMDSIFAVKYNINQSQPDKYDFSTLGNLTDLSKNKNALSLGIFVPGGYKNVKFTTGNNSSLENQTKFVNALAKTQNQFFKEFYTTSEKTDDKITGTGNSVTLTQKATDTTNDVSVTYGITAPAHSQAYLSVPNISYISTNFQNATITISNTSKAGVIAPIATYSVATEDTGSLFNLGYYDKATSLSVTLSFPNNSQVSFDTTSFWALDTVTYQSVINKLKENKVFDRTVKNGVNSTIDAKSAGQVFLTLPYDKGWSAKLDGQSVKIHKAQNGFMTVNIPKGKHQLNLRFFPQGLKIGIFCFILGIFLFVLYDWRLKRKQSDI